MPGGPNFWSIALRSDGSVWAWGFGNLGILGTAATEMPSRTPVNVAGLANVVAIAAGAQHAMAIATDAAGDRSVWTWGEGAVGQLGTHCQGIICGSPVPFQVPNLPGIAAITAGALTSIVLGIDGSVWTWGANTSGILGGDETDAGRFEPGIAIEARSGIVQIAAGHDHVVAVRRDGTVIGWGGNRSGQLGDGTTTSRSNAALVGRLTGVRQVAAGGQHTLASYTKPPVAKP